MEPGKGGKKKGRRWQRSVTGALALLGDLLAAPALAHPPSRDPGLRTGTEPSPSGSASLLRAGHHYIGVEIKREAPPGGGAVRPTGW
jgi:hypothetical protein